MKIQSTIKIQGIQNDILRTLQQMSGRQIGLRVMQGGPAGSQVVLSLLGRNFSARLEGQALQKGNVLLARVGTPGSNRIELKILSQATASALATTVSGDLPVGLLMLAEIFLGRKNRYNKKASLEQAMARLNNKHKQFLNRLMNMAGATDTEQSGKAGLPFWLQDMIADDKNQRWLPETYIKESLEFPRVESGQDQAGEQVEQKTQTTSADDSWQIEAFGRLSDTPAYFFVNLQTESLGQLWIAIFGLDAEFRQLAIFLESEHSWLRDALLEQRDLMVQQLFEAGILVQDFRSSIQMAPRGGVDFRA